MADMMGTHGARILVVEDHEDSRELLLAVARVSAPESAAVATVEDARRAYLERQPALVITDYELPDGNGLELLRWIRNQPRGRDSAVLLVSAHRDEARLRDAAAVCGASFLPKPVDMPALHEAIRAALGDATE